ncbi:hypothetical protein K7432_000228 [Basidiobolus ranarum]|uniref:Uncharacterized protein n=1 Tax=Basidiobolus ranarum TaxID=34480 RepID=A0ABR2WBK8_9FUNG
MSQESNQFSVLSENTDAPDQTVQTVETIDTAEEVEKQEPQVQEAEKVEEKTEEQPTPEEESNTASLEVVSRICGIPLVQDSINAVKSFVEGSESRYVHLVADTAGSAMHTVAGLIQPVQTRFHSQIEQADQLGCRSLDYIENKVPIIKRPTNELVQTCRTTVEPYIEGVTSSAQNLVQNVRSIVQGK